MWSFSSYDWWNGGGQVICTATATLANRRLPPSVQFRVFSALNPPLGRPPRTKTARRTALGFGNERKNEKLLDCCCGLRLDRCVKSLTVVVPVYNTAEELSECLPAIGRSHRAPDEVIVVDDGSPPDVARRIAEIAAAHGARLIYQAHAGTAAARNRGAREAAGAIIAFIDADVRVHAETLGQLAASLDDAGLAAVFGSYDDRPAAATLVSDFRNLLHHYVHQVSRREAATFWAGCGAVRRSVLETVGGLSETFLGATIEDVELGLRLTAEGHRIELHPEIQATHLKHWTLGSFLATDLLHRAIPWARLMFERRDALRPDLNFGWSQRISVALAMLLAFSLFVAFRLPLHACVVAVFSIAALAFLNRRFLGFLGRLRGPLFALLSFPLYIAHFLAGGLGFIAGALRAWQDRDPRAWIAAVVLIVAVFGLQAASGAYQAGFDGYPDEPSHFVTGVMAAEFMRHPSLRPLHFAEQYYLHYPKVAIGHWPPFMYFVEGAWFILFGGTRTTALLLEGVVAFALLLAVYVLVRLHAPFAAALAAALLILATKPIQQAIGWVMADSFTALLVLGAGAAFGLYLKRPGFAAGQLFGLLAALGMLAKGSAVPVLAVPALAVLASGRHSLLRRRDFWLSGLPVAVLAVPWYWFALRFRTPNLGSVGRGDMSLVLCFMDYGAVLLLLAGIGAVVVPRRDPFVAAMLALVLAFTVAPLLVPALNESRHYMPSAAACAVLAGWALGRTPRPAVFATLCFAAALAASGEFVRHAPARFRPWVRELRDGGPILISGSGMSEGAFVAAVAEQSPRPRRIILRASRVLADSSWNGDRYRLLVRNEAETRARLSDLGVHCAVQVSGERSPHDDLLTLAIRDWRPETRPGGIRIAINPAPPSGRRVVIDQRRLGRSLVQDP
ncbi:MAG: glycosyltransferase [Acidobacteria bacterium]|nr:glycosyltransferase [Acidobacteriota bacterium]